MSRLPFFAACLSRHHVAAKRQARAQALSCLRSHCTPRGAPTASISLCGFTALLSAAVRTA